MGERTAGAARGFRFRDRGSLGLRGKSEPIRAFLLLEKEEEPTPGQPERGIPGIRAPLVGRDSELDLLSTLYDRVASERTPHLVTISGDPGVRKPFLADGRIAEGRDEIEMAYPVFQQLSSARELGRCRELLAGQGLTL